MSIWIRFRCENGDCFLANAEQTHLFFKTDPAEISILPAGQTDAFGQKIQPLYVFNCENSEQVHAAEDLIFEALCHQKSVTISLEVLDEHAEYLSHVHGIRMVLELIHQGSIRIPVNVDIPQEKELFMPEDDHEESEIKQFERILSTYLHVPSDVLREAWKLKAQINKDSNIHFTIQWDLEDCSEHGAHEYWKVCTLPDRSYRFREDYNQLATDLVRKEGYRWEDLSNIATKTGNPAHS